MQGAHDSLRLPLERLADDAASAVAESEISRDVDIIIGSVNYLGSRGTKVLETVLPFVHDGLCNFMHLGCLKLCYFITRSSDKQRANLAKKRKQTNANCTLMPQTVSMACMGVLVALACCSRS